MTKGMFSIVLAIGMLVGIYAGSVETAVTGESPIKAAEAMRPAPMGGAGCDGHGAPATCSTCSGSSCEQVCVGYNECVIRYENGHPSCVSQGSCTGGGFGAGGGFTWIP